MLSRAKHEYYKADQSRYKTNEQVIADQVQQGRALPNDLREAELKTMEAGIEEEKIGLDIFSAQIYLSYMMGYDTLQLILPKESLTAEGGTSKILRGWELIGTDKNAIGVRPDVQEQKINTKIAEIELQQSKAGRLPVLSFEGYLGVNNFTYNFNPVTGYYGNSFLGLSLRYPIYGGGEKKTQIVQSEIQLEQQKENVRKLEQQAFYEIVNSANKVEYQAKQVGLQQQRIKIQDEKISLVKTRLEAGRALPRDLLDEETRLMEIKKNYYQNLHDLLVANVEFRKALGKSPAPNQ
jgi:outer membrane protein TolC